MEKQKRLSQDSSDKIFRRDSSHEKSPKKLPARVKSDGLGEDEGTSAQKRKSRGSTLSPKLSHSSPTGATPVGSPQSSRSGSIDHGKADGIQTSRPGTPTISTPLTNRNNSPVSGDANNLDEFDPKDPYKNVIKPTKGEGSSKDHGDQEEEDEENEEQVANEEYKLQVKNSGRTNEELRSLIEAFSTEQLRRYEVFRRSSLNKANTRLLLSSILSQQTTQNLAMIVAGFSKVFVGEIVELALDVKKEWDSKASTSSSGDPQSELVSSSAPLQPHHLREAYRRYIKQNTVISGPRGPIAPASTAHHNGVPSIVSRPRRFFKR